MNLNYPDYRNGFGGGGSPSAYPAPAPSLSPSRAPAMPSPDAAIPWLQNASAGANILGTAISAYGQLQQAKQAEKNFEAAMQAWRQEQERQQRIDAEESRVRALNGSLAAGQYAMAHADDIEDPYVAYARSLGY